MKRKELYAKQKKAINKAICNAAPGFYTDEYWHGKGLVVAELDKVCSSLGLTWENTFNAYGEWGDDGKPPTRKVWGFKVVDESNNRESYGIIVAAGAGTVKDPLSRYDICAYIS